MAIPALVIAAGIAAASGIINKIQERRAQKKQNEANLKLADKQFALDQEAINRQNAYNAPLAQMGRYTDANLNPNLIYGSGASAGNQGSAANYDAPQMQPVAGALPDFTGALSMYQDFQMRKAQIDNINASTENTRSRTVNEALRGSLLDIQGRTGEFDLDTKNMLRPYQATIAEMGARKSAIQLKQDMERLSLLKQSQLLNILKANQMKIGMTGQELSNERQRSEILYNSYRNQWMKEGVTTADNPYIRILSRMLGQAGFNLSDMAGSFNRNRR